MIDNSKTRRLEVTVPPAAKRARQVDPNLQRSDASRLRRSTRLHEQHPPPSSPLPSSPLPSSLPPQPKIFNLTAENLALLDNMAETGTKTTNTISTTSTGFEEKALDNGILGRDGSKAPTNIDDLRTYLNKARESASPSASVYNEYVSELEAAPNEWTVVVETRPLFMNNGQGYRKAYNQALTAVPKEVGFNNGLSAPQPDFIEGLGRQAFRPFPIAEELGGAATLVNQLRSIALPHMVGEWKAQGKDMKKARIQSSYDGATLVYGRDQALRYLGEPDAVGEAAVVSFTSDGSCMNFFSHHAEPNEDGKVEYHQYPIDATVMTTSHEAFKRGWKQIHNAEEYARKKSFDLRDRLVKHWKEKDATEVVEDLPIEEHVGILEAVGQDAPGPEEQKALDEPWIGDEPDEVQPPVPAPRRSPKKKDHQTKEVNSRQVDDSAVSGKKRKPTPKRPPAAKRQQR